MSSLGKIKQHATYENKRKKKKQRGNIIKNGQPRDTGNIGYTRNKTKTNKIKKTTTQKLKR